MADPNQVNIPVHLNLNVRGLSPSATLTINERCNQMRSQGRRVYKLGLGQSPFPVALPVVEALKANAFQKDYLPVPGLRELREAVADYFRRLHHLARRAEDVLVGPGSKELMFLLQLVYYGELVIPTPSWVSYAPQAQIVGRRVQWVPTKREQGWRVTPEYLEELCWPDPERPRILVLNYPNNPTGLTYTEDELKALAEVARKYRMVLLSDEIYGRLHHQGEHVSISRFYPEGTIISSGLSKWCGAGGWRLGVFAFPRDLRWLLDAMAAVASETYTSTSAPIQYAAVTAFLGGSEIERYLQLARRVLRSLGRECARRLQSAGIEAHMPEGAFYLFPDFGPLGDGLRARGIKTSAMLCERLLEETGVAILPGAEFGRPPRELTARLAYVDFHGGDTMSAAERAADHGDLDARFLHRHCGTVLDAMDLICEWANR